MAIWKNKELRFRDLLDKYDEDSIEALKYEMVGRLREDGRIPEDIIENFQHSLDQDDFNEALDQLYDFCDDKRIWVTIE